MTSTMSPADCLRQRFEAHRCGDYAAIYASYHPESSFLQQFPDLATYEVFAYEGLASIQMISWQCTLERHLGTGQVECIQIVEFSHERVISRMVELALLIQTSQGWRYHSAQKLGPHNLPIPASRVEFSHFDQVVDKVRF